MNLSIRTLNLFKVLMKLVFSDNINNLLKGLMHLIHLHAQVLAEKANMGFMKVSILTMNGMDLGEGLLQMVIIILASGEMECATVGVDMFITRSYHNNRQQEE